MLAEVAAYCKARACLCPYFGGEGMGHRGRFCVCVSENGGDLNRQKWPLNDGRMMITLQKIEGTTLF
jgi:hypothetical protein